MFEGQSNKTCKIETNHFYNVHLFDCCLTSIGYCFSHIENRGKLNSTDIKYASLYLLTKTRTTDFIKVIPPIATGK